MAPVFLREWLGSRDFPREPEPSLVMDDEAQARAYDQAGRIDGVMAAAYLFHTAHISRVIAGKKRILDLACGPATQLLQVALCNPDARFTGVDLSSAMLDRAQANAALGRFGNVEFRTDDITRLETVGDASVDAVISTMALHHLPSFEHLLRCFAQIHRVLVPGGALYLADFGRLKSLRSVLYFAYQNSRKQPHLFSLDYERSLRAAFLPQDFQRALDAHLAGRAKVVTTFAVPLLILITSQDGGIDRAVAERVQALRKGLQPCYRRDLDDLRLFFRLGGLSSDPFARNSVRRTTANRPSS